VDFLLVVAAVSQITWIQVQADMPQLVLVKELMTVLVANEETFGECGEFSNYILFLQLHVC
jgi:hypothetical protein